MSQPHYNAFISYRRTPRDTAVAVEIQHSLEHFRVPKGLRESSGLTRIDRIFRDQEELAITSDLSQRIEDALLASDYLIIICSPGYLESKWCLHEVEFFLQTHDLSHVLCVLSEGEPPSVFPELLLHRTEQVQLEDGSIISRTVDTEPLACDYRSSFRQARRRELPRLAAVLLGCSYDELVLRRERYRRRRLSAIFASAAVLALAAVSYLLWSNAQITRSYHQALINESRLLAQESMDAFDARNRFSSIRSALQALIGDDPNRPLTDEAQFAIAQATYAYFTPWSCLETWRINLAGDITDFLIAGNGTCLVCLDRTGEFHSYDLASHRELCSFRLSEGSVPSGPVEGPNGDLLCYDAGDAVSVDCRTGTENWRTPLQYRAIGTVRPSPDGTMIAAADSYAVQVMSASGEYMLSLPLPEDDGLYITDLCWSPDSAQIAVTLRDPSLLACRFGVFQLDSSAFSLLEASCARVDLFRFEQDGILYLLGDDRTSESLEDESFNELRLIQYRFYAWRNGTLLREQPILAQDLSGSKAAISLPPQDGMPILLSVDGGLFIFDQDRQLSGGYEVGRGILSVLSYTENAVDLITADGQHGLLNLSDGSVTLQRLFPKNLSRVEPLPGNGSDRAAGSFAVLAEGNLLLYETVYDDNLSLFDGDALPDYPDDYLLDGDRLMLLCGRNLIFCDLGTRSELCRLDIEESRALHLLKAAEGRAWALEIDGESAGLSLLCYDMESGSLLSREDLSVCDTLTQTILSVPLSQGDAMYLNYFYDAPSPVAVQEDLMVLHGPDDPNHLLIRSLSDGTQQELDLSDSLGKDRILLDRLGNMTPPSPLLLSPDGSLLLTICTNLSDATRTAILIQLSDGTVTDLPLVPDDFSASVLTDDLVICSGRRGLCVCDTDGQLLYMLPYSGEAVLDCAYQDGLLYCIYPDRTLRILQGETELRRVPLSFPLEYEIINGKSFQWEFTPHRLYLYCGTELNVITLDSDGSTAVYYADLVLTRLSGSGELLVCCNDPAVTETAGEHFPIRLASYREYTVEELIARAEAQLAAFQPAPPKGSSS